MPARLPDQPVITRGNDVQPVETARNDVQPVETARNADQPNRTAARHQKDATNGRPHARTKETLAILKIGDESLPNQPGRAAGQPNRTPRPQGHVHKTATNSESASSNAQSSDRSKGASTLMQPKPKTTHGQRTAPSSVTPRWANFATMALMLSPSGGPRALPWLMTLLWLTSPAQAGGREGRSAPSRPAPYNNFEDQGQTEDRINTYVEVILNPLHERSATLPWGSTISSSQRLPPSWLARRQTELFTSNGTFPTRAVPLIFVRAYSSSNLQALETELRALRLNRLITTFHHASPNQTAALRPLVAFTIPSRANRQPPQVNANQRNATSHPRHSWSPPGRSNSSTALTTRAARAVFTNNHGNRGPPRPANNAHQRNANNKDGLTQRNATATKTPSPATNTEGQLPRRPRLTEQLNPFAEQHDTEARRLRHQANAQNIQHRFLCATKNASNPCRYTATSYTPSFRGDQRTDPPRNPHREAGHMWRALHAFTGPAGQHYGPHAIPSLAGGTSTSLLPGSRTGLFAITGDLACLPPACPIVVATDITQVVALGAGPLRGPDDALIVPQEPFCISAASLGPYDGHMNAAITAHRRTAPLPGSFVVINLHWTPAEQTNQLDYAHPALMHPLNGPTIVAVAVANGITECLADPSAAAHQAAVASRLQAFDLGLLNLAAHMEHTQSALSRQGTFDVAPLPLFFNLTVPLPMEPSPGEEHSCPPEFNVTQHMIRSIRNRLAGSHACYVLTLHDFHLNVLPHVNPYWQTPWSNATCISENSPAHKPREPAVHLSGQGLHIGRPLLRPPTTRTAPPSTATAPSDADLRAWCEARGWGPTAPAPATAISVAEQALQLMDARDAEARKKNREDTRERRDAKKRRKLKDGTVAPPTDTCKGAAKHREPDEDEDDQNKRQKSSRRHHRSLERLEGKCERAEAGEQVSSESSSSSSSDDVATREDQRDG
ncbi:MAG: hypothetical protein WCH44_13855, partial [Betaproteobacteria bacterium]